MNTTVPVLGVHGVRSHQGDRTPAAAAQRMAGWWQNAINDGLRQPAAPGTGSFAVDVAYYAHHLYQGTAQGDEDPGRLEAEAQRDIVAWARLLGAPDATAQGWVTSPAAAAISWVAEHCGLDHALARILATTFFREVHTYFTDTDRRDAARTAVADAIISTRPRIVLAHSLGSVLAYEALWAHEHPPVDLLVTLGSPLAMPDIVYDRLAAHPGERGRPPGVDRWINIADPGDIIAIPASAIPQRFTGLTADLRDAIGAFAYHKATTYLQCGTVSGVLATYL